jgi:hypothetical protein
MSGGQEDRSEREQKDEKDIYAEKLEITVFFFHISIYVESRQTLHQIYKRQIKEVLS